MTPEIKKPALSIGLTTASVVGFLVLATLGFSYAQVIKGRNAIEQKKAEQENEIEKLRIQEESRSNDLREAELEQKKLEALQVQTRNDTSVQLKNTELRKSFFSACEKKQQEVLDMLSGRMNYLGCNDDLSRCQGDYSYKLYIGWLYPANGKSYIESCIDSKIEELK